jgi:hypothetical protein
MEVKDKRERYEIKKSERYKKNKNKNKIDKRIFN